MTFEQISEATGISKGYVNRVLIKVVAQTLKLEYQAAIEIRQYQIISESAFSALQ